MLPRELMLASLSRIHPPVLIVGAEQQCLTSLRSGPAPEGSTHTSQALISGFFFFMLRLYIHIKPSSDRAAVPCALFGLSFTTPIESDLNKKRIKDNTPLITFPAVFGSTSKIRILRLLYLRLFTFITQLKGPVLGAPASRLVVYLHLMLR